MPKLTQIAVAKWPKHALSIRSLNPRQHKDLIERLEQLGWKMIVTVLLLILVKTAIGLLVRKIQV